MKIKFFATYRDLTGCKELDIPAPADALALLETLALRFGPAMRKKLFAEGGVVSEDVILFVNGRNIFHISGTDTPLSETDTVSLFPMVAGG